MKLKLVAMCVLVAFSSFSVAAVAKPGTEEVSARAEQTFDEIDQRLDANDADMEMARAAISVENGGIAVMSPVNVDVNVDVPPMKNTTLDEPWEIALLVVGVVLGVTVISVSAGCADGRCGGTDRVSFDY